jgi:O-antigen/teichoic acid export membrane protein
MSITRNTISNLVFSLSKSLSGLILIPLFVGQVGKESYGIVVLLLGIVGYAELFDLGLKPALVRNLTAEKLDQKSENEVFIAALAGSAFYFIVSIIFLVPAIFFLGARFGLPTQLVESPIIYLFVFFYLFINIINPIFSALLISKNRFDLVNYRSSFFSILGIGLTILLVWVTDLSYYAWMIATLLSKTMELLVLVFLSKKYFPYLGIHFSLFSWKRLGSLIGFGWKMLLSKWNKKIKFDSDPLVLSYFLGPASLAIYRPGSALVQSIRPIVSSMAGQLFVSASKAHRDENKKSLQFLLISGSKFTVLAYLPIFFTFCFYGEWMISLWLGKAYQAQDIHLIYQVLVFWSLIDLFFYIEGSAYSILFGINQLDFMIKADLVVSIINIICSVILIKYFQMGILSVLIPGVIIEFFVRVGFFINTANRIDLTYRDCLRQYFLPLTTLFIIFVGPFWLLSVQTFSLWIQIPIYLTALIIFYPVLSWKLVLNDEERRLIRGKFGRFIPFIA